MSYKEEFTRELRNRFLRYTRDAFETLPKMNKPRILELGCGSGTITLELAYLSDGKIVAIDIDEELLVRLRKKVELMGLAHRIELQKVDLLQNSFSEDYFDLIWEEGVVHIIGLQKSLDECHRILRKGGFLVLGQAIKAVNPHIDLIEKLGFKIVRKLNWAENCWWNDYYGPLEEKVKNFESNGNVQEYIEDITAIKNEIEMVKADPKNFDCAHYILKKL